MKRTNKKINAHGNTTAVAIVIVVAVLVIIGIVYLFVQNEEQEPAPAPPAADQQAAVEDLTEELESLPEVEVPSADPLQNVKLKQNPLETTNPFNDEYQNPFE